jgi:hypothetical protein
MTTQLTTSQAPAVTGPAVTAGRGLTRGAWHRIGAVVREMNYATCRLAELNVRVRPARPGA